MVVIVLRSSDVHVHITLAFLELFASFRKIVSLDFGGLSNSRQSTMFEQGDLRQDEQGNDGNIVACVHAIARGRTCCPRTL